jgi:hypothetical protein
MGLPIKLSDKIVIHMGRGFGPTHMICWFMRRCFENYAALGETLAIPGCEIRPRLYY